MPEIRRGARLALDWGAARIGVAACDRDGILAFPVEAVPAGPDAVRRILALVGEYEPVEVLLGLPRTLAGDDGIAAEKIRIIAVELAGLLPVPLRLVDERLTTAEAAKRLHRAGRNTREQRSRIDAAAAAGLLEHALAVEASTGGPPGEAVVAPVVDQRPGEEPA